MPRLPRIQPVGLPLHITQRGNNRAACFFEEADYLAYLHWLREGTQGVGVVLHGYALITNHVHLLVTPQAAGAVLRLVQTLGRHYVHYINKRYGRSGTLWEWRYRASLIEAEDYLLEVHCWKSIATSTSTRCAPAWSRRRKTTAGQAPGSTWPWKPGGSKTTNCSTG